MIQTECTKCGNKRAFEDSYAGRKFKCPVCSSPVEIQKSNDVVDKASAQNVHENNDILNLVNSVEEKKLRTPNPSTTNSESDILPDSPSEEKTKLGGIVNDLGKVKQQEKKSGIIRYIVLGAIAALFAFIFIGKLRNDNFAGSASSSDVYQPTQSPNQYAEVEAPPSAAPAPALDTAVMPPATSSEYAGQDNNQGTQNQPENAVTDEQSDNINTIDEDVNRRELLIARIRSFYRQWQNGSMQTANYFADNVEVFFNKKNLNKSEVENAMAVTFREFVNFNLDLKNISFEKKQNGIAYYRVEMHFKCFRVKMQKYEECDDTELIGINSQNQFVYLKEEKIENLKFYK